jgi:hypothetical protein
MQVTVLRSATLTDITSVSGVEVVDGIIYLLADDSSFLYKVKHDLTILEKIPLFESTVGEHIPKPDKADLECMAQLSINGYKHLLVLGSGSRSPQRDKGFLIKLPTNYNRKHLVWPINLSSFYTFIKNHEDITTTREINIEGLSVAEDAVYMLNRGTENGSKNVVASFDKAEFIEFIQGHTEGVPFPKVHAITLPLLSGVQAQFTGADYFDGKLFFTGSAEATDNAYDDGAITGSVIGLLKTERVYNGRYEEEKISLQHVEPFILSGATYKGKVESVSVYEKEKENMYTAIAVTDNDGAPSDILLLEIQL